MKIELEFKNGGTVEYTGKSFWTDWRYTHDHYKYFDWKSGYDVEDDRYLCFHDSSFMNPVSRETKRQDYKTLRDKIQATGNEANYFEENGTVSDDWCVSIRYDQLDWGKIYGDRYVYKHGSKYY